MTPDEESKLRAEASRGQQAKELMEHPLMVEALQIIRSNLTQAWETSPARDDEGREKLWMMQHLLKGVEGHLKQVLETGTMASLQLSNWQKLKMRASEWIGLD